MDDDPDRRGRPAVSGAAPDAGAGADAGPSPDAGVNTPVPPEQDVVPVWVHVLSGAIPLAGPRRRFTIAVRTLVLSALRFRSDFGFEKAASLAYSSLLALIPTALLAVSIAELLGTEGQDQFLQRVLDLVLPADERIRANVQELIQDSRAGFEGATGSATVRIVSVLMLLYFAGSVLTTVDRVVAHVWGGGGFRAFMRRLSAYWAVVTLGPFLLALSFAATTFASGLLGASAGGVLRSVFPFFVSSVAIFLFYRLMPHSPVRTRAAVWASVVAGVLWETSKIGLGWWFARPHTSFLTKLSFFPMALLWMYVSWAIVIYGLEVAYVVHHGTWREGLRGAGGGRRGAARELLAVAAAVEIVRRHNAGETPDRADLAGELGAAENDVADVVDALVAAGVIGTAPGGGFVPARGADGIPAILAIRAVRGRALDAPLAETSAAARTAAEFVARVEQVARDPQAGETLGSLARASSAAK